MLSEEKLAALFKAKVISSFRILALILGWKLVTNGLQSGNTPSRSLTTTIEFPSWTRTDFRLSSVETFTEADFRFIFDVNVLGVLNVTAACVPYMKAGSAVVNFASVDGFTVSRGQLLYGASKSAVIMITKSLALELAHKGIRVNGIAPGWVATPGNAATGRMEEAAKSIPIGRVAQPSEIAEWVWLLSDSTKAGFVDGETIVISGADVMR